MIPVELTLKGLYSYRKEQKIDFTKLLEGQLFGIFGTVGSGKSSIMEAVSFALYDQTERLNLRDKRNYNMMNLKSDSLLIDFIFKDYNETLFRFKVSASRKKNKEEVSAFVRQTYLWEAGRWVARTLKAEEIIGLSYENFQRTIIIPQGKFQEFLQLKESERTRMMKDIFKLERFDLSDKVSALLSKVKLRKENIDGQLLSLESVSLETIAAAKHEGELLSRETEQLTKSLEQKRKEATAQESIKKICDSIQQESDKYTLLKNKEAAFIQKEKKLQQYEQFFRLFSKDLEIRKQHFVELEKANHQLKAEKEQKDKLEQLLTNLEVIFKDSSEAFQKRDQQKQKAIELEKLVRLRQWEKELLDINKEIEEKQNLLNLEVENVRKWEKKEEDGHKKLQEIRAEIPDTDRLMEVKIWFENKRNLEEKINNLSNNLYTLREKLDQLNKEITVCFESHAKAIPETATMKGETSELFDAINECRKGFEDKLEALRKEMQELNTHSKLEDFARNLKKGMPCPLCGALEHPILLNSESANERLQRLVGVEEILKSRIEALSRFEGQIRTLHSRIEAQKPLFLGSEEEIMKASSLLEAHQSAFIWMEFDPGKEAEIENVFAKARENKALEKKIVEGIDTVRERQQIARQERERLESVLNKLREKKAGLESTHKAYSGDFNYVKIEMYAKIEIEVLLQEAKSIIVEVERIEQKHKEVETALAAKKEERAGLLSHIALREKNIEECTGKLNKVIKVLEANLKTSGVDSLEQVEHLLSEKIDVESERSEIELFRKTLFAVSETLKTLKEQIADNTFDADAYALLMAGIEEEKQLLNKKRDALAKLKQRIEDMEAAVQKKEELQKELGIVNARAENLKVLSNLFRSSGFVNYISSKYLVNLCNTANERFYKLTRQQFRMEVSENNDFQIRDFLNNGKLRSVKTLSGGQTFQASLCLALALADSIQQQNKARQNFFFLDEGFGSQDKESLRLVFDTLKALRREHRIVGVISHVEELQQEIDVCLKVHNDPEEGSIVKGSWE